MRYIADGKLEAYTTAQYDSPVRQPSTTAQYDSPVRQPSTTAQYDSPVRRTFLLLDQLFDFGFEFVGVLFP